MNKILKWTVISLVVVFALILVASAAVYLYKPGLRESWVKPGVDQEDLPTEISAPTAFKNVNVIPMDRERVLESQTVVVEDRRITYVGNDDNEIPADAHIVDGTGKYLMPGLADMHTHVYGNENDLLLYVANGVTTIRTMGGEPPDILEWRDQIRAGSRLGPTVWAWWPSIRSQRGRDPVWLRRFKTRGGEAFAHTPEEYWECESALRQASWLPPM